MQILKTLARVYVPQKQFDEGIAFYEQVFGTACELLLPLPALGLEVAKIGSVHLIAGSVERLKPFRLAHSTFMVNSVMEAETELKALGAEILRGPEGGPGGSFLVARHPDGLVVEYVDQVS